MGGLDGHIVSFVRKPSEMNGNPWDGSLVSPI